MRKFSPYRYHGPHAANQSRSTIIDDPTALWAARMCVGEATRRCTQTQSSALLWALMNRWMLHPARNHWPTFLFMMRRFSQPINPRWQKGGDLARKYAGTKHCAPYRLRNRAMISSLSWQEIPEQVIEAVRDFQAGTLPPPEELAGLDRPRISNWAGYDGLEEKCPWGIAFRGERPRNCFFEDARLIRGSVVVDYWG